MIIYADNTAPEAIQDIEAQPEIVEKFYFKGNKLVARLYGHENDVVLAQLQNSVITLPREKVFVKFLPKDRLQITIK